jgi:transcriptional regulator with XRE-family HTH domain
MARVEVPDLGAAAQAVVRSIRRLRAERRMTSHELAARCAALGTAFPRFVITNLENGRRSIVTVDELAVVADVFGVDPWSMTSDIPVCLTCRNDAPPGYACLVCGHGRRSVVTTDA